MPDTASIEAGEKVGEFRPPGLKLPPTLESIVGPRWAPLFRTKIEKARREVEKAEQELRITRSGKPRRRIRACHYHAVTMAHEHAESRITNIHDQFALASRVRIAPSLEAFFHPDVYAYMPPDLISSYTPGKKHLLFLDRYLFDRFDRPLIGRHVEVVRILLDLDQRLYGDWVDVEDKEDKISEEISSDMRRLARTVLANFRFSPQEESPDKARLALDRAENEQSPEMLAELLREVSPEVSRRVLLFYFDLYQAESASDFYRNLNSKASIDGFFVHASRFQALQFLSNIT